MKVRSKKQEICLGDREASSQN